MTRSFDAFFDLRLNKWLSKQSWGWWFEMLPHPLWCHCNAKFELSETLELLLESYRVFIVRILQKYKHVIQSSIFLPISRTIETGEAIKTGSCQNTIGCLVNNLQPNQWWIRGHHDHFPASLNTLHDDVIKWKHFPPNWPFVREIHRSPVNSPHKGQWRGALMFSLVCIWINDWVNNREAGDLRCYRAHYDIIVMGPQ